MIGELLRWLMIPCPRVVRQLGYPAGYVAIEARARRHRAAWAPHLTASHAAIRQALDDLPAGRLERAVVLGSGPLLDIPFGALAARFAEVILVDIVHAPWIMRRARTEAAEQGCQVHFMTADLSGVVEAVVDHVSAARLHRSGPLALPEPQPALALPPLTAPGQPATFCLSACLLSQLPAAPLAYLERRLGGSAQPDEAAVTAFHDRVQATHLALVRNLAPKALLITDIRREICDGEGRVIELQALVAPGLLPAPVAAWDWAICPPGERRDGLTERRRVEAYVIN